MTAQQRFRYAKPLRGINRLESAKVFGKNTVYEMLMIPPCALSVRQARRLRGWLNKVLP